MGGYKNKKSNQVSSSKRQSNGESGCASGSHSPKVNASSADGAETSNGDDAKKTVKQDIAAKLMSRKVNFSIS